MRQLKGRLWPLVLALLMTTTEPAMGFKQGDPPLLGDRNHQSITRDALLRVAPAFRSTSFSEAAIAQVEDANQNTDRGLLDHGRLDPDEHFWDARYHFDAEQFYASAELIVSSRNAIVAHIRAGRFHQARRLLGVALHTLQDFYAHSNWVEKWLADSSYPHPAWTSDRPFGLLPHQQPEPPGSPRVHTCDEAGVLAAAPLTTGYYDLRMLAWDRGAWTNQWVKDNPSWPEFRCVHGGDGHSHGLNKDDAGRHDGRKVKDGLWSLFELAWSHAAHASQAYVQDIVDQLPAGTPDRANLICGFLGQESRLCEVPTEDGKVAAVAIIEPRLFAGLFFTVSVQGTGLSPHMRVELSNGGVCRVPDSGTPERFEVQCTAVVAGVHTLRVKGGTGTVLASQEVVVQADNARISSLLVYVGETVRLWAQDLYVTVKAAVWSVPEVADAVVANVVDGVAQALSVVFNNAGDKLLQVEYQDATGQKLGGSAATLQVRVKPVITAVSAAPPWASPGTLMRFAVTGMDLHPGLSFVLQDCADVQEDPAGDRWQTVFTCTIAQGAAPGTKQGVVATTANPLASPDAVLRTFSVEVTASNPGVARGLVDTGVSAAQCYRPGSHVLTACGSSDAQALGDQQDGMVGRDAVAGADAADGRLGFSYATLPGQALADCVRDNVTGLVWENKAASGVRAAGYRVTNVGDGRTGDASSYVAQINAMGLCGRSDWRLPTADELLSLADFSSPPDGVAAVGDWVLLTAAEQTWSSTPVRVGQSMFVDFRTGDVGAKRREEPAAVRLVSGASAAPPVLTPIGDGAEVHDASTGLVWRRCVEGQVWTSAGCAATTDPQVYNHEQALLRAKAQATTDKRWRLPNAKELTSIVRRDRAEPAAFIDEVAFPGTRTTYHWTSTPVVSQPEQAWTVYFGYGSTGSNQWRGLQHAVRLVRDGTARDAEAARGAACAFAVGTCRSRH